MIEIQANRTCRIYLTCAFTLWLAINALYIAWEAKPPFLDVFLFKEAGVNLAVEGKFVAANLPHMPREVALPYAYYAPLYPLSYGVWTSLAGVGLKQSILFDHLIKGLRTLLLFLFVAPWLIPRLNYHGPKALAILASLLCLSFLPYYNDRPDELALVFGLLSWILLAGPRPFGDRFNLSGVCLGLCAASSPAASVLFGLGCAFYFLRHRPPFKELLPNGLAVVLTFSLISLPVFLIDRHAWGRFSAQLPLSVFPYAKGFASSGSLANFCWHWIATFWFAGKFALLPMMLFFGTIISLWPRMRHTKVADQIFPFLLATAVYAPLATLVWSEQPRYLWFPCITAFLMLASLWLNDSPTPRSVPVSEMPVRRRQNAFVFAALALAVIPGVISESRYLIDAFELPVGQTGKEIRERVLSYIEPTSKLAVPPDQFFTFRPAKEVSMAYYVCPWLDEYDYIYVTNNEEHSVMNSPLSSPCAEQRGCFTAVHDFRDPKILTVLGYKTTHQVYSNGGVLFKNTHCRGSLHAQNS